MSPAIKLVINQLLSVSVPYANTIQKEKNFMIVEKECTSTELAGLLDITKRHVRGLAQRGIIKKLEHGKYDTRACIAGYIEYLNNQIPNKSISGEEAKSHRMNTEMQRAKLLQHKAELARLEEEEKKGTLVNAEDEKREAFKLGRIVRNSVMGVPARISQNLAAESDSNAIYRLLETELVETLTDIADLADSGDDLFKAELAFIDPSADCFHWCLIHTG